MTRTAFTVLDDGRATVVETDEAELTERARSAGRPLALDVAERAAWLGVSAAERGRVLTALDAPDFALPDVSGRLHRLSDHRGRKVLLVVWASW